MVIFNSYVKLPEGIPNYSKLQLIHRWFIPPRGVSPHLHPGKPSMGWVGGYRAGPDITTGECAYYTQICMRLYVREYVDHLHMLYICEKYIICLCNDDSNDKDNCNHINNRIPRYPKSIPSFSFRSPNDVLQTILDLSQVDPDPDIHGVCHCHPHETCC